MRRPPCLPTRCRLQSLIQITPWPKCALLTSVCHTAGACSWYLIQSEPTEFASSARDSRLVKNEDNMKKRVKTKAHVSNRMRPEYDFSKGVRGKHAARYASGTNVVVLAPDVSSQFPTADDVNQALRAVSRLIERWSSRSKHRRA